MDPARPTQAIALLQKGIREMPDKWQYYHDAGFVEYWWRRDAQAAADWFLEGVEASRVRRTGCSRWRQACWPKGASATPSRALWTRAGEHRRAGVDAADGQSRAACNSTPRRTSSMLQPIVHKFYDMNGRFPTGWQD